MPPLGPQGEWSKGQHTQFESRRCEFFPCCVVDAKDEEDGIKQQLRDLLVAGWAA